MVLIISSKCEDVSHMDVDHNCSITPSMWQQTFGPHELVRMHGAIKGHKVLILKDDGASHNFLNYKFSVKRQAYLALPAFTSGFKF